jgi:hypothetical protein
VAAVVPDEGRRPQVGELHGGRVHGQLGVGAADVPVDAPGGVHAPLLQPEGMERDLDPFGPRQRAPAAAAVAEGRDPGTQAGGLDGDDNGAELEPAAGTGDDGGAKENAVVGGRGGRQRREQRVAARDGIADEEGGGGQGGSRGG